PPVVERSGRDHRDRAPDRHPGAERPAETPEPHCRGTLLGCTGERRAQYEPAARPAGENAAQVDRQMRRSPEGVPSNRAMPRDIPDDTDTAAGRSEQAD